MNLKTITLATIGLMAGAAIAVMWSISTPENSPPGTAVVTGKAQIGGPFKLIDHNGRTVTDKDFHGKYMLIFFGFTHCPDICPSSLQVVSAALKKIGKKADEIQPIFITLDSKRDTPDVMAAYIKSFDANLVGLTGSTEDLAKAAKAYRVYYQKVTDQQSPESYSYDHSSIFYLMGKNGDFIAPIPHTNDPAEMAEHLSKAIPG